MLKIIVEYYYRNSTKSIMSQLSLFENELKFNKNNIENEYSLKLNNKNIKTTSFGIHVPDKLSNLKEQKNELPITASSLTEFQSHHVPHSKLSSEGVPSKQSTENEARYLRPSKDVLKAQLHMLLLRTPIDFKRLVHLANVDRYIPSYYYYALELEKQGHKNEALKWYKKSTHPDAYLKSAKIYMEKASMNKLKQQNLENTEIIENKDNKDNNNENIYKINNKNNKMNLFKDKRWNLKDYKKISNDEIQMNNALSTQKALKNNNSINDKPSNHPTIQIELNDNSYEELEKLAIGRQFLKHKSDSWSNLNIKKNIQYPVFSNELLIEDLLRKAASKGIGEASYELGMIYMYKDWKKSLYYFIDALKNGWVEAIVALWKENDPDVCNRLIIDVIESIKISEQEKLLLLGYAYQFGYGKVQDSLEAIKLFEKAASFTSRNISNRNILFPGNSRQQSSNKSLKKIKNEVSMKSLHSKSSIVNNQVQNIANQALNQVSKLQSRENKILQIKELIHRYQNEKKLRKFRKNINHPIDETINDPEIREVYDRIKKHICVSWKSKFKECQEVIKELLEDGYIEGIYIAADFYSYGYPGIIIDMNFSNRLYKCSASVRHVEGMLKHANNLLYEYEWTGIDSFLEEAVEFYTECSKKYITAAMCNLASLHERGLVNRKINYKKAAKLYNLALKYGDPAGANGLAALYFHGNGVPKNYLKTVKLLFEAIDHGDEDAYENLSLLCSEEEFVSSMMLALEAFRELAQEGNKEALNFSLRLQSELGYKQNWDTPDAYLRSYQKNMSFIHFENMDEKLEYDGHYYYTVTCIGKIYELKAFKLSLHERIESNVLWSTMKREIVPHIQIQDNNLHQSQFWAADTENIYIMREKIDLSFRFILEKTKWNYTHELVSTAFQNESSANQESLQDILFSSSNENLEDTNCIYDTIQKLEDLIIIAKAIKRYHEKSKLSHQSICSRHILLSLSNRIERLYRSKVFSRLYNPTSPELNGNILITNHIMPETRSILNYDLTSYAWCSPEVIRDGKYSFASDAYAFGMLLYEFLTHSPPYSESWIKNNGLNEHAKVKENSTTIMNKILRGELPQIPIEIKNYKGSNYFVTHIIELIKECCTDTRSRLTFDEIIHKLEVLRKRIRVHKSREALSQIFTELKIEQYIDKFAQEELSLKQFRELEESKIYELLQNAEIPAKRILSWRKIDCECTSKELYEARIKLLLEPPS